MKPLKNIFIGIMIAVFSATNCFASTNCENARYRRNHPERCNQYESGDNNTNIILSLVGGAALVGVGVALANQNSGNGGSSAQITNQVTFPRLTLSQNINVNYEQNDTINNQRISSSYISSLTNGSDIETSVIKNIKQSEQYKRNYKQYDAINFAWANARGLSGKNVNINIIDDFKSYHGYVVNDLVKNIAGNANVKTYNIAVSEQKLNSYDYIANTINTSEPAHIYNASWQIDASASKNAATVIYNQQSPKTYADAQQYLYNMTGENLITQIRNTAVDNDAIFVWAAGNDSYTESGALSAMPIAFPELQGHFVNVIALDTTTNQIAWYSNQCGITQNYCIAAPGSRWDTDSLDYASGTSFAAPVVSGAIAVIKEAFPYMSSTEITQLLFTTAQDLGAPGIDSVYGWGLLDMEKATKPVGTPKIVLSNDIIQPLSVSNVSGSAASALKNANVKIAFVDDFGRAFTTNLSDNIKIKPFSRAFEELTAPENDSVVLSNGFEFGVKKNHLLESSGLISTSLNNNTNFIGYKNENILGSVTLYQNIRFGITHPKTNENSMVSNFSDIYTTSMKIGAKWQDLALEISVPETIMHGNMFLDIPVARENDGKIIYNNTAIDLSTKNSVEYTLKYKNLSMTYVNNPDYQDEFFIMAKGKFTF
nr:S8 family serine peptidase [Candidatus Enterousia merdequi]